MLSGDIIKKIEGTAPLFLADSWDNSGLQIGSFNKEVKRVLISLDLESGIVEEAVKSGVDMIITHHPFFFSEMKSIVTDGKRGEMIKQLIKNDITVYSAHTNLDIAQNGMTQVLADKMEVKDSAPLVATYKDDMYKITVYVPAEDAESLREAIGKAGAGKLGDYEYCSFSSRGTGRFKPLEGADPHIGEIDKLEEVCEEKIEFIAMKSGLKDIISAMLKAHPYEEVGYDVFLLENGGIEYGYGGVGSLDKSMTLLELGEYVKEKLELDEVRVYGDLDRKVSLISFCGGSGASFISNAAKASDVYVTGDIKYHDAQKASELGLCLIDAGHFGMEKHVVGFLAEKLQKNMESDIEITTASHDFSLHKTL